MRKEYSEEENNLISFVEKTSGFEFSSYQLNNFKEILNQNSLISWPTGSGKSYIAFLWGLFKIKFENLKVIIIAPTNPLLIQHYEIMKKFNNNISLLNSNNSDKEILDIFENKEVILSTIELLVSRGKKEIFKNYFSKYKGAFILDEIHKYNSIKGKKFIKLFKINYNNFLGLSASPYKNLIKKEELLSLFNIKKEIFYSKENYLLKNKNKNIIFKNYFFSSNNLFYKQLINYYWRESLLEKNNFYFIKNPFLNLNYFTEYRLKINNFPLKTYNYWKLNEFFNNYSVLFNNENFISFIKFLKNIKSFYFFEDILIKNIYFSKYEKVGKFKEIILDFIKKEVDFKIISFFNTKKNLFIIKKILEEDFLINKTTSINYLIGKNQNLIKKENIISEINTFKNSKKGILLCTSVAEEGIHIPNSNFLIIFDSTKSLIRNIQRFGRVGRGQEKSDIFIFINESILYDLNVKKELIKLSKELFINIEN